MGEAPIFSIDGDQIVRTAEPEEQVQTSVQYDEKQELERAQARVGDGKPGRITLMMNWWCHPLNDETCITHKDARIDSEDERFEQTLRMFGAPVAAVESEKKTAEVSLKALGSEIREKYFYDHDGSKQRAWEASEEAKQTTSENRKRRRSPSNSPLGLDGHAD